MVTECPGVPSTLRARRASRGRPHTAFSMGSGRVAGIDVIELAVRHGDTSADAASVHVEPERTAFPVPESITRATVVAGLTGVATVRAHRGS